LPVDRFPGGNTSAGSEVLQMDDSGGRT